MQGKPWTSHFSMSAFSIVERRRREELLAIQNQDRLQTQTTAEPDIASTAEQPDPPPEESRMPLINATGLDRESRASAVEGPAASLLSPPILDDPALYGLAGRIIRSLAPHSEADPVALLLQFLAAFGNLAGPAPHSLVGSTRHGLNLFVILVGESSKARKGTSWRQIAALFAEVDQLWTTRRVTTPRPTAATILQALQDQLSPTDRRLFLLSEEFASVLPLLARETAQLSPLLRCAWDGGDLSV